MAAAAGVEERYGFELEGEQIDMRLAITELVRDMQRGEPAGCIAARFHNTIAAVIVEVCENIRRQDGLQRVCLSGGTFQNWTLLGKAVAGLRARGFEVFLHSKVPPNDGGIALGQAAIASFSPELSHYLHHVEMHRRAARENLQLTAAAEG